MASTRGRAVQEGNIQKEVKSNKKQDTFREEVKVVVMKCDAKFPDVLACSLYDTNTVRVISTVA